MLNESSGESIHTMRNDGRHESNIDCKCKPMYFKRCPEECRKGCWACGSQNGWTQITYGEAIVIAEPLHIVHRDL